MIYGVIGWLLCSAAICYVATERKEARDAEGWPIIGFFSLLGPLLLLWLVVAVAFLGRAEAQRR